MGELDYKESWALNNWFFWTVVLGKTLESPLDRKEIKPVHPKGNQSWIFIGRTDAEAETPILWSPDVKNWLIGKDLDAGKDNAVEEAEDRGWDGWWHHWHAHEFESWSWMELVMDREASCAVVHVFATSQTRLNDWTEGCSVWLWDDLTLYSLCTLFLLLNQLQLRSSGIRFQRSATLVTRAWKNVMMNGIYSSCLSLYLGCRMSDWKTVGAQ